MDENFIYGFLGGIIGGICVNIVSFEYQKFSNNKEKEKIAQIESRRKIIERLKEIEFTLEKEVSADHPIYKKIQNECVIYSNQLTTDLSKIAANMPEEIIVDLKKLSSDLIRLGNFPIYQGYDLLRDCRSIIESSQKIIREIENYSNN